MYTTATQKAKIFSSGLRNSSEKFEFNFVGKSTGIDPFRLHDFNVKANVGRGSILQVFLLFEIGNLNTTLKSVTEKFELRLFRSADHVYFHLAFANLIGRLCG
jgi:hypothetical protein